MLPVVEVTGPDVPDEELEPELEPELELEPEPEPMFGQR
jgi:hypothetical protein